ncbi:MAG: Lrp/AsnC family transcriptional regulator [Candidatus Pacearchaeota archaeon]
MEKLTKREKEVLKELLINCKVSDQEIARKLKTSRPTIFKIRKRLEKENIIKEYIPRINLEKFNLNVQMTILYKWKDYSNKKELEKLINFIKSSPEIIFFSESLDISKKINIIISFHENLEECENFLNKIKDGMKNNIEDMEIVLSSRKNIIKNYDFSSLILNKMKE